MNPRFEHREPCAICEAFKKKDASKIQKPKPKPAEDVKNG